MIPLHQLGIRAKAPEVFLSSVGPKASRGGARGKRVGNGSTASLKDIYLRDDMAHEAYWATIGANGGAGWDIKFPSKSPRRWSS
ncbi:hypothetical protein LIER_14397 [Lithospermum erythrorhizon]|uniref:Uncharacterized protein n=1 Tax=Lithospermum erythrorhizon TaxID=34254 RepID=A0AAV3PZ60_LITER